jgi:hypothetical protein
LLTGRPEGCESDIVPFMENARLVVFAAIGIVALCGSLGQRGVRMRLRDVGKPRSSEQQRKVDSMLRIGWSIVGLLAAFGLVILH